MILWYKAPKTAVGRVMTVITHHPVIVHLKGVVISRLTVDIYLSVLNLQVIALIYLDTTLINREVL